MNWRQKIKTKNAKTVAKHPAVQEPAVEKATAEPVVEEKVSIEQQINNNYNFDPNKTYLVVGGKVKEIGSKSKYLLDMLIIKEEN